MNCATLYVITICIVSMMAADLNGQNILSQLLGSNKFQNEITTTENYDYCTSCAAIKKMGYVKSSFFMIDSDGEGGDDPFLVFCDMQTDPTTGITVINHNYTQNKDIKKFLEVRCPVGLKSSLPGKHKALQRIHREVPQKDDENVYVFTDCGGNGRFGPTEEMCNNTYKDTNVRVTVEEGMQTWIVPRTGRYKIEAKGPAGQHYIQKNAGRGATASGELVLNRNDILKILVGQKGTRNEGKPFYGGSGGTFVARWKHWVLFRLMVAGGGGCGSKKNSPANYPVTDASESAKGKNGSLVGNNFGHGGIGGDGGERGNRATGPNTPGGGAGWSHDGIISGETRWGEVQEARAFTKTNGQGDDASGVGGRFQDSAGLKYDGGFGGGGSAALHASGGAGGYSGGGGGPDEGYSGGGGSIVNVENGKIRIDNEGPGIVRIEFILPNISIVSTKATDVFVVPTNVSEINDIDDTTGLSTVQITRRKVTTASSEKATDAFVFPANVSDVNDIDNTTRSSTVETTRMNVSTTSSASTQRVGFSVFCILIHTLVFI